MPSFGVKTTKSHNQVKHSDGFSLVISTMKLIEEYYSQSEAEAAQEKLRKRGILSHVSSKQSHHLSSAQTGAFRVGLWAIIDNQYADACKILSGHQCKVRYPLNEAQMKELERSGKAYVPASIIKFLFSVIGVIVVLMVLLYKWKINV